jgi:hypothetical protein
MKTLLLFALIGIAACSSNSTGTNAQSQPQSSLIVGTWFEQDLTGNHDTIIFTTDSTCSVHANGISYQTYINRIPPDTSYNYEVYYDDSGAILHSLDFDLYRDSLIGAAGTYTVSGINPHADSVLGPAWAVVFIQ